MGATYNICVDWNNDGDFSDAGNDVTSRTLARTPLTIEYGRDIARTLSPVSAGRAALELDNQSKDYSPEYASSPLAGNLVAARPVRIQATLSATTYTLFRGHIDEYEVLPNRDQRSVRLTALDALARLRGVTVSTDLYQGITTGQAIGYILDAAGWSSSARDLDTGATAIRWWWEEGTDAFSALEKVIQSEGPPALVTVDTSGSIVFRDRHHRLLRPESASSQATFRDTGGEPKFSAPLVYDHGWRNVVNSVEISVDERDPSSDLTQVWSSSSTLSLADGETLAVHAATSDPFFGAVVPEEGTDYNLQSGTVTLSLSRTQGASTIISVRASGGPAVLDSLKLRAYSVGVRRTIQVRREDSTSQSNYGVRSWPDPAPWAGVHDANAIADIILAQRAERLPIVSIRVVNGNDTRLTQQLSRDLSDRVTIVDAETGLSADFYIEHIQHSISEAGLYHETVFSCEKVPTTPSNLFAFDVAGRGFSDGCFGLGGLSDAATAFRFDTSGQGFDQGLFAY